MDGLNFSNAFSSCGGVADDVRSVWLSRRTYPGIPAKARVRDR
jgi:hypothetical protein